MKVKLMVVAFFVVVSLTSLVRADKGDDRNGNTSDQYKLAHLVDYELTNGYMRIKVLTSGCTGINSFVVAADEQADNGLSVFRVKADQCGMKVRPIELQYSIRHLGIDINRAIKVLNPLSTLSN